MPVTFNVASHDAQEVPVGKPPANASDILAQIHGSSYAMLQSKQPLQSSLDGSNHTMGTLVPRANGFVHAILEAYGRHHHLRIRPDDVWLAILTQINFYVNAHGEEMRQYFVAHEGQEALRVAHCDDTSSLVQEFVRLIGEHVVDKTLVEWILPDFSTTTLEDRTICSIVMMSTLKSYFKYFDGVLCGIPSVTLEGEKADWERIYLRLSRLDKLGDEPSAWAGMLRPIIRRFIQAFDGEPDRTFWGHVLYRDDTSCSGPELSGWLTAFCVWSHDGVWLPRPAALFDPPADRLVEPFFTLPESTTSEQPSSTSASVSTKDSRGLSMNIVRNLSVAIPRRMKRYMDKSIIRRSLGAGTAPEERELPSSSVLIVGKFGRFVSYKLDGVEYFTLNMDDIPPGYAEVDLILEQSCSETPYMLVAGHVAYAASAKEPGGKIDTVSPSPQWFVHLK